MAVGGRKGQLAVVDVANLNAVKEFQVGETVRDVAFLHNKLFFAAAQKKYTYIYNRDGTELHCLKEHGAVLKLQLLKNDFLLSSINKLGQLHYQDVTTGEIIDTYRTGLGRTDVTGQSLQQSPFLGPFIRYRHNVEAHQQCPSNKNAMPPWTLNFPRLPSKWASDGYVRV